MAISFKSVGKTREQRVIETLVQSQTPIGIKTPIRIGDHSGLLGMHYNLGDQIADNLRNLILTNHGERIGLYNFGANLQPLVFDYVSQDNFDTAAINSIKTAVERWMPFVDLEDFVSVVDRTENKNTAIIRITITYNVPSINVTNRKLQVSLYAI